MSHRPDRPRQLREGFTTGSAATAAAMAALHCLLCGEALAAVPTPLPPLAAQAKARLIIPIAALHAVPHGMLAAVIKDGGDDPDVTHGARIEAVVTLCPAVSDTPPDAAASSETDRTPRIVIDGGQGVGRVTLPGLPCVVGQAAINPGPRAQLELGLRQVLARCPEPAFRGTIQVIIQVPDGERLAVHTFNPRLGIVGGISILGTRGTVRPYSHEAWQQTIIQELHVARAMGCTTVGLCSGRRSERLLLERYPLWPEQGCVQAADYVGLAVRTVAELGFDELVWGCFFGKLIKVAQGHGHTHAHVAELDMPTLARTTACHGLAPSLAQRVAQANTAAQALDIMSPDPALPQVLEALTLQARQTLIALAQPHGQKLRIRIHLFHLNGTELVCV